MKVLLMVGFLAAVALPLHAVDSAYSALRVVGKREGQDVLNRVVEVRGRSGSPQPAVWKVVVEEPRARGGVRELEVQRGKIIGERTPTGRGSGSAMNFNQLNLDSEGAFTIANQEAQKNTVAFDRVDYLLKSGSGGGSPVWELELFDGSNGRVGAIEIAADSGTVLHKQIERKSRPADNDRAYLDDRRPTSPPRRPAAEDDEPSSVTLPAFLDRVGRHLQKRSRQLENFFTGK